MGRKFKGLSADEVEDLKKDAEELFSIGKEILEDPEIDSRLKAMVSLEMKSHKAVLHSLGVEV